MMSPDRVEKINGVNIEEYYWAGRQVVYVNNRLSKLSFNDACDAAAKSGITANVA